MLGVYLANNLDTNSNGCLLDDPHRGRSEMFWGDSGDSLAGRGSEVAI